jgi:hypothetical protein
MADRVPRPGDKVPGAPPALSGAPQGGSTARLVAGVDAVSSGDATNGGRVRSSARRRLETRATIAATVGVIFAELIHQLLHRNQFHHTRLEIN